jgi:hypothetical protein
VPDDAGLAELGQRLLDRIDELTGTIVARIQEQIPVYRTELVPVTDQEKTVRAHLVFALAPPWGLSAALLAGWVGGAALIRGLAEIAIAFQIRPGHRAAV